MSQSDDIAQALEQALARFAEKLPGFAVDRGMNVSCGAHRYRASLAFSTADSRARRVSTAHRCFL